MVKEADIIERANDNIMEPTPESPNLPAQTAAAKLHSHLEACSKFADALELATQKTLDHFIKPKGSRPYIKRSNNLDGIEKTVKFTGKRNRYLPGEFFGATIKFEDRPPNSLFAKAPRIGISGRPINVRFERIGTFVVPYATLASEINDPSLQNDMARYVEKILQQCGDYFKQNNDQTDRIREIALGHVQDAVQEFFLSHPPVPRVQNQLEQSTISDMKALQRALQQAMQGLIEDIFIHADEKPKVSTECDTANLIIFMKTGYVKGWFRKNLKPDIEYSLKLDINPSAKLERDWLIEDNFLGLRDNIPYSKESQNIAQELTAHRIKHITKTICNEIRKQYSNQLKQDNFETARNLEEIFSSHLTHALAAAFGGELSISNNKALELANVNEDEANTQFRNELNALKKANRSEHFLLQTFGMAAGNKAGEDASVIAEWQIGRTLRLPDSLNKIRHIHDTLARFAKMDIEARAGGAGELLSQMRSLQKTITRDNKALLEEAKSIHSAKSVMSAHERILQKYVQGFNALKDSLTETFGSKAVLKRDDAITTSLLAVQIHAQNQESIHERLNLRMLEQISDFSTHLSFLAKSMQEIVDKSILASLLSEGQTVDDLASSVLAGAGIGNISLNSIKGKGKAELEQELILQIEDLRKQIEPMSLEIENIEEQLLLASDSEERLLLADHSDALDRV